MCMGCVVYGDLQIHRLRQRILTVNKYRAARANEFEQEGDSKKGNWGMGKKNASARLEAVVALTKAVKLFVPLKSFR